MALAAQRISACKRLWYWITGQCPGIAGLRRALIDRRCPITQACNRVVNLA